PDVLVLNEIDYDPQGAALAAFCDNYLAAPQHASQSPAGPALPISFPHRRAFPSNTGEHSGHDLDRNGTVDATLGNPAYGNDCFGYGIYPGEYAMALLSRYPVDEAAIREFRKFLWKDMPGAMLPDDPATPAPADWYSADVLAAIRLSSKNHVDVPVLIAGRRIHLLLSHPTPPVFDGLEDRNGRRNHDELRFWRDYIADVANGGPEASGRRPEVARGAPAEPLAAASGQGAYITDDAGRSGGLAAGTIPPFPSGSQPAGDISKGPSPSFIIAGDLNGDPYDGDSSAGIVALLAAPQLRRRPAPASQGGAEAARVQGAINARHRGDPAHDTEDGADDPGPGNLRLDYLLPSADLAVAGAGVFWPETADPLSALTAGAAEPASSDHRLVWIDLTLP
ncbi:MAG TPA: endonuclease/exonuclease/phosphatase family protein, partial [Lacipirellulaceae bacterium]|nr:endonuclease/exonuclease/phosphatase family protein [Lacipirellulaceae bacterium]